MKISVKTISKLFPVFAFLFSASAFFTACGGGGKEKPPLNYGGTFNVNLTGSVETLDPNEINYDSDLFATLPIYEGLVKAGENFDEPEPFLATSWEKLNDGRKFVFHLRKDVKFHADPCFENENDRKFSSYDALFTFERIAEHNSPGINYSLFSEMIVGMPQFHAGKTKTIEGIKIIDSLTIEFNLTKPYVTFLKLLASSSAYMLSQKAIGYYGEEFDKHPIGTGPFKLSIWNPIKELFFIKNNDYWRHDKAGNKLPFLDAVSIKILSSPGFGITDFLKGECDFVKLDRKNYQTAVKAVNTAKFRVEKTHRNFNVRFYGFSFDKKTPLTEDKNLRRAIAYSFNRRKIFNSPSFPFSPAQTLVPLSLLGNTKVEWYSYDLLKGKTVADKINTDDVKYLFFSSVNAPSVGILEKGMKSLGLKVKTKVQPKGYYRFILEKRPDIFRVSMMPSFPDPTEYYSMFYSKSSKFTNLFAYSNNEFDIIYEQSLIEQNKRKRQNHFLRLEKILRDDAAALYVSEADEMYNFISLRVENFKTRNSFPDFSVIRLKK